LSKEKLLEDLEVKLSTVVHVARVHSLKTLSLSASDIHRSIQRRQVEAFDGKTWSEKLEMLERKRMLA
jgi:hypothetical protein